MLAEAARSIAVPLVAGRAEELPVAPGSFDFLSMGYALRHVSDLGVTFAQFFRALRPGGTVCLLELTAPRRRLTRALVRWYMKGLVPCLSRLTSRGDGAGGGDSKLLWQYYWDTIDQCVAPETVMNAMTAAGFVGVRRHLEVGLFSEYTGRRPDAAAAKPASA
jgi:demethylmenaquinone methyltransferase/2-methoxy-6-polyprenyl-1,4-benzoquinol methylase